MRVVLGKSGELWPKGREKGEEQTNVGLLNLGGSVCK